MAGLLSPRSGRITPVELITVLVLGVAAGLVVGYVLMGTAHAIMEIGADLDKHFKQHEA